ncbi:MAG: C45 family autoproteolytic acyltransferase/hydrolase [Crocinitomicaceae bacterium]
MKLQFNFIAEIGFPGIKFKALFDSFWPDYRKWLESEPNKARKRADLETSIAAMEQYMPEMLPIYHNLCHAVQADELAAQFLTGFQPPPYLAACSQAVLLGEQTKLVRNYDYHPQLLEGTILKSLWQNKQVIATTDCLAGVLDGVNEDGLSVSLTFGGRNVVGKGFGIPFILRYILEFCSTVDEAIQILLRVPCHMSYNVTVLDQSGAYKTVFLSPDRDTSVNDHMFTTNHQEEIDWEENAVFNKTEKRYEFLNDRLADPDITQDELIDFFQKKPLYSHLFSKGFGTVYTAIYHPKSRLVEYRWPNITIHQSINYFTEYSQIVQVKDQAMDQKTVDALAKFKKTEDIDAPSRAEALDKMPKKRRKKNLALRKINLRMS